MIAKTDLQQISSTLWEIPKTYRSDMRVPARIFCTDKMLDEVLRDRSLEQLINVATLPGIQKAAIVMPDAHEGYGFPIGAVAATAYPEGSISPGGIGYDINCGVRLLKSEWTYKSLKPYLENLAVSLYREIPSGVGHRGRLKLSDSQLNELLKQGVGWMVEQGYGDQDDLRFIESRGVLPHADPGCVSDFAKNRGRDQLGTMGAGNHFVQIDRIDAIYDPAIASVFGLVQDHIVALIHTGSRGLGHQVATDYIRVMLGALSKYDISLPDRELACAPLSSSEGTRYFNAMAAAANFAWCNRQLITWEVRNVWHSTLGPQSGSLSILYDVAHNIAKVEEHEIDGRKQLLIVHRKGATRAFGPNHPDLVDEYKTTGQPVIIPGSMGTASYVLVGTHLGMKESFGSSCHGAGRRMSRHAARRETRGKDVREALAKEGILVETGSISGLAEEAPLAYKDIGDVVDVVVRAGIAKKVARLRPVAVIKG